MNTPSRGSGYRSAKAGTHEPLDLHDEITRPDLSDDLVVRMAALFGSLKQADRDKAIKLIGAWAGCSLDRRVLIEALARELAKVPPEVT